LTVISGKTENSSLAKATNMKSAWHPAVGIVCSSLCLLLAIIGLACPFWTNKFEAGGSTMEIKVFVRDYIQTYGGSETKINMWDSAEFKDDCGTSPSHCDEKKSLVSTYKACFTFTFFAMLLGVYVIANFASAYKAIPMTGKKQAIGGSVGLFFFYMIAMSCAIGGPQDWFDSINVSRDFNVGAGLTCLIVCWFLAMGMIALAYFGSDGDEDAADSSSDSTAPPADSTTAPEPPSSGEAPASAVISQV